MDINRHHRFLLLLLALLVIGAIFVLVSGVSTLDLDYEGEPLPRMSMQEEEQSRGAPPTTHFIETALRVLFAVVGALLPFAIIYYLISPAGRRRLLGDLIALSIILVPLYLLWRAQPEALSTLAEGSLPQMPAEELPPAPEVAFVPEAAQWLSAAATIAVALLLASLLVGLGWAIWRRRQHRPQPVDELAQQAQEAIDALEEGADLRDTVTRCYFQMMRILQEERGIRRQQAMTPREFEAELEQAGMPLTQVRRLTRLFEEVRYGDKQLGKREERQAVVALTAVTRLCRGAS